MGDSDHPNHTVLARELPAYLRRRNANARHPDILAAQRRERVRIRSERQQRWGRPRPKAATCWMLSVTKNQGHTTGGATLKLS
jgi:hypothetical protein